MSRVRLKPNTDATIRYDAAMRYFASVYDEYEAEAAAAAIAPECEVQRRKSQVAFRKLVEALLLYVHEVAKLKRQHERPN